MKTIAQEFAEHCRTVYPPELLARMGDDNLEELRRTFYIGYQRAWDRVRAITGGQMPEGEAVHLVQATALELGLFFEALKKESQCKELTKASLAAGVDPAVSRSAIEALKNHAEKWVTCFDCMTHSHCRENQRCAQMLELKKPEQKLTHNGWPIGADLLNMFPKHIDADGKAHY